MFNFLFQNYFPGNNFSGTPRSEEFRLRNQITPRSFIGCETMKTDEINKGNGHERADAGKSIKDLMFRLEHHFEILRGKKERKYNPDKLGSMKGEAPVEV